MSSRMLLVSGTVLTAVVSVLPQLTALLILSPTQFGVFSIAYLAFAFGSSLILSIVCEPWSRSHNRKTEPTLIGYGSASTAIGLVVGIAAASIVLFMDTAAVIGVFVGVAVSVASVRTSMRYVQVYRGWWRQVVLAEVANVSIFLVILTFGAILSADQFTSIMVAWCLGSTFSLILGWPLLNSEFGSTRKWIRTHRTEIRPLLRDSLLMDVGAIIAPVLLVPSLGVAGFGTYRAVSNVSAPVRLLLNPLRAVIGRADVSLRRLNDRRSVLLLAVGLLSGICASIALFLVGWFDIQIGVLTSLVDHAIAVGIFVAGNFLGHYAYIRCRQTGTGKVLLVNRLLQTSLMVAFPLLGALMGGLSAAIWGLSVATVVSAVGWVLAERPTQTL